MYGSFIPYSPLSRADQDRARREWRLRQDAIDNSLIEPGEKVVSWSSIRKEAKHQRREKRRGLTSTGFCWDDVLDTYGHRCGLCQSSKRFLTVGHIIPLSKGVGCHQWNIRPECHRCNNQKGDMLDSECDVGRVEGRTLFSGPDVQTINLVQLARLGLISKPR